MVVVHSKHRTLPPRLSPVPKPRSKEPRLLHKFFCAGFAACAADALTFPFDVAKVRLQIQGEGAGSLRLASTAAAASIKQSSTALSKNKRQVVKYKTMFGTIRTICAEEGIKGIYGGLVPGLQRQMAFSSIRIGLYDSVKGLYQETFNQLTGRGQSTKRKRGVTKQNPAPVNISVRLLSGVTTGCLAIVVAQPTDVVKVRMQAQVKGKGPLRYSTSLEAYKKIAHEEGLRGLYKGTTPNMLRNSVVNCCELVSYDIIKEKILALGVMSDALPCHFTSGLGAGFITTVVASPIDVVKTRFMNSGRGQYKGIVDCAVKMGRENGLKAFYKGFWPSFTRIGCWNIAMFVFYEKMKSFAVKLQHQ